MKWRQLNPSEEIERGDQVTIEGWASVDPGWIGMMAAGLPDGYVARRLNDNQLPQFPPESRKLDDLDPGFRDVVIDVLAACLEIHGAHMLPICTFRPPDKQARLWRSSRTSDAIAAEVLALKAEGRPLAAAILEGVGPQDGKIGQHVTWALPGESLHNAQPALAIDVAWVVDGSTEWSVSRHGPKGINGYVAFREEATKRGLKRGPLVDWCHVQADVPKFQSEAILSIFFEGST